LPRFQTVGEQQHLSKDGISVNRKKSRQKYSMTRANCFLPVPEASGRIDQVGPRPNVASSGTMIKALALIVLGFHFLSGEARAQDDVPLILQQPLSQAVEAGTNVTLEVIATNTPTLYYQWFKDGAAVSNATQATLSFNPVALSDAGNYFVVVSNDLGSVASSNAVLAVRSPGAPIIRVNGDLAAGSVTEVGSATISMESGFSNGTIFYTLDGSAPDSSSSPAYSDPVIVSNSFVVRALGLNADTQETAEAPPVTVNVTPLYSLALTVSGNGTATADPSNGPYTNSSIVSLTATPDPGWVFDHWSGDASGSNNPISVSVTAPMSVQAVFVPLFSLTATSPGGGSANVNPTPGPYPSNSVVSVTASPGPGWTFLGWQGDAGGTNNPLSLTMDSPKNISAVFGIRLGIAITFPGGVSPGTVELSDTGIVPYGTTVRATAIPSYGSFFETWKGAVTGTNNPVDFVVVSNLPVIARFGALPFGQAPLSMGVTAPQPGLIQLSWPYSSYYYFVLETATTLSNPLSWTAVSFNPHNRVGNNVVVTLPTTNAPQQFFRVKAASGAPVSQFAIFYNGLLEFSTCATMTVNGRVHCNTNIFVGAGSSGILTFNALVTAVGTISAPTNNGANWGNPTNFNSSWRTVFNATPTNYVTNVAQVYPLISLLNPHSIIDLPTTADDWTNTYVQYRLFNEAQVVLLVSNTSVMTIIRQATPGIPPAGDPAPYTNIYSTNLSVLVANLPFLSLMNTFYDGREKTTNITTQLDVGKYASWLGTNAQIVGGSGVAGKFPVGSGTYPTILYVADNRTTGAGQMAVVRLANGIAPPSNGGQGFSVATPNPLYIWGNYNQTNNSYLATTNTSGGTVPCAFLCDALTILSSNWSDSVSFGSYASISWNASAQTTVNAAIVTGIVPTTGTDNLHFSGGIHNLPRLLEDWSSSTLWLNTSIVNLFLSTRATNQFLNPGVYYNPPTRKFSFDQNFANPDIAPPGIPLVLPY
jgi:hypothetical protein